MSLRSATGAAAVKVVRATNGADSIQIVLQAMLRNNSRDTLEVATTCDGGLFLQYAEGASWTPAIVFVELPSCQAMFTSVRVAPGDSTVLTRVLEAIRAPRLSGVRWVAPLPGQFRVVTRASSCSRNGKRACYTDISSPPFPLLGPGSG
ncbi:MAG: hypothetical protein U0132_16870 [Gemmatimonadaceae bacterium]